MIDHERALELSAAVFDFELSPADSEALTEHLAACESCRAIDQGLRADAVALVGLQREDASEDLRRKILEAVGPEADALDSAPVPAVPSPKRRQLLPFPTRLRHPAVLVAAAAVIVAVVGGTLAWQNVPSEGGIAVTNPSSPPASGSADPSHPAGSTDPGDPGPTNPPGPANPDLVTAWTPVAELTAQKSSGGVVDLDTGFLLAGLAGTPATELASHVTVKPALTLTTTTEADGRVRLTPAEPLTPGAVYQFTLTGDEGQTLDSWAFQARQPLRVVSTVPAHQETDVRRDTGIEVTFDQDGVVDAAAHMTIEPKVKGRFEQHDRVLAFVPDRLEPATIYTVTVSRGVAVGATGEQLEEDVRFEFETAAAGADQAPEPTFRFSKDLFESATADRPVVSVWAYGDFYDERGDPEWPTSLPLEVYRLPDRAAAIDAFQLLRSLPRWSQWHADDQVPTAGLKRVAGLDAHLEDVGGTLWTRLPEALPVGWYLVQYPSTTRPAQAILQVTDISGYLMVSETQTLVWANDLATGTAIGGAKVGAAGTPLGSTKANGTLVATTPPALLADLSQPCARGCEPVVTIDSGGHSAFLPATGSSGPDGQDYGGGWWDSSSANSHYWRVFNTDRTRYRRTDTVNVWGMLRDRESGKVPATVTLRLVVADGEGANPPIAQVESRPRPTGAFTGSLDLRDVPEGYYQVELVEGGDVMATQFFEVGRILKPAYRLQVETGRRVYIEGDRVKVTATASFYEGTPVPGVPLRMSGFLDSSPTTDATGTAIARGTAKAWEDFQGPRHQTVDVSPARADEGEIEGASREFMVFPSMWTVGADSEIRAGRVRITGTVNVIDRDRLEAEIADGAYIWDLDPRGAPVSDRTVRVVFTELIPIRRQTGTTYDFIEKRVVPVYEYETQERSAGTLRLKTDGRGRFSGSVKASGADHDYSIRVSLTDPDGHVALTTSYASKGAPVVDRNSDSYVSLTDRAEDAFSIGDELDVTMRGPGDPAAAADDRHLFYIAQQGLRDFAVQRSARFVTTFPAWGPPNVYVGAVRFTGSGYVVGNWYFATFRSSDRAITVDLQADRARYAPGDEVTLRVRTRRPDGRALPATVVLGAVDEKLYSIGAAYADDPLPELYASLDAGIRATYASHQVPRPRPGSGDATGGGDGDFRDSVLFKAIDTDADGRATVTFRLSADLTSWHVSAGAIGAGLEAGSGTTVIPVGLPFFVDAAIAPEYLLADRPAIQIRGFGAALDPSARVTFTVDSASLGLHESGLRADAFEAVTVRLPKLTLGTHSITITARTGSGSSARTHRVIRSFEVVPSRLTRARTSYEQPSGTIQLKGGSGLTDVVVSDASSGQELPLLFELASGGGSRLERALAAEVARSLIVERFGAGDVAPSDLTFDGSTYQRGDGGIAILPYSSSDLEVSALAALVAPDRFDGEGLKSYFEAIRSGPTETRERRNIALAGLAGLGASVLPAIRTAAADPDLTIRERLMLGLGAAAIGDAGTARDVATSLVKEYGEAVGNEARLRVGDDAADVTAGTSLLAMLMAAIGDPAASRYRAYVQANPSLEATYALHEVGYVARRLAHRAPKPASFAYVAGGKRTVIDLEAGESFHLTLTRAQAATFSVEPLEGAIGVTTGWTEPVKASVFEKDPDVKIERTVKPSGTVDAGDLVVIDLRVTFGPKAAKGCHRVTELVPSGLVPVSVLRGIVDTDTGEFRTDITYPEEQAGQRVVFCAGFDPTKPTVRLRYVARVITVGTYAWEPTIVESRSAADRAAIVPADEITIR
jgi:alpha-2-macroglobulin